MKEIYEFAYNIAKSKSPSNRRNNDKSFQKDQLWSPQTPTNSNQASNLSNLQPSKDDKNKGIQKKPSGYKFVEKKYNYFNKYHGKIGYQPQEQNFEAKNFQSSPALPVNEDNIKIPPPQVNNLSSNDSSISKQIKRSASLGLNKQEKVSDNYRAMDKAINSTNPGGNQIELKNDMSQIFSFELGKISSQIVQAYHTAENFQNIDNPNSDIILPIPKSSPKVNCNIGLPCIGNSCYMNSVLQILASTEGFDGIISTIKIPLFSSLANVLQIIKSKSEHNLSLHLSQFKNALGSEFSMLQGWRQNDPKNLFQIIVSKLTEQKPAFNLFLIQLEKILICRSHEAVIKNENMSIFMVDTSKKRNMQSYVDELKNPESFKGANALYCDRCGCLRDMVIETKHIETSANLVFYLFPSAYFIPDSHIYIENNDYTLYGVICYKASGCYSAFTYCEAGSTWIEYSCSKIAPVDLPDFRYVCMLFYKNKI
ncbi:unnamed protein product [Blepharisma stoltei]|uniref:USP domain-containing protein n=1 Tax=Blepharisma stoltei TaxID=1481888 RepID=A0AAU9IJS1_9CILI|nr:unnamed protein product [Blepharisma stoltei]